MLEWKKYTETEILKWKHKTNSWVFTCKKQQQQQQKQRQIHECLHVKIKTDKNPEVKEQKKKKHNQKKAFEKATNMRVLPKKGCLTWRSFYYENYKYSTLLQYCNTFERLINSISQVKSTYRSHLLQEVSSVIHVPMKI